jgi:uncharacterized protein (TIGR03083 family)
MLTQFEHLVEAWEQSARSIIGLGDGCSDADWERHSRCPGWTVKDLFSHTIGLERLLLGEPLPQHDPGAKEWIRNDFGKIMEIDVDLRRSRRGTDILEELREVIDARHALLSQADGSEEITFLEYTGPQAKTFPRRITDVWMHEQDIRAALGKPGGMDSPGAHFVYDNMSFQLSRALSGKGLPAGGFTIRTDRFERHYLIDEEGKVALTDAEQPTILAMSAETWVAHVGGRSDAEVADITISGDADFGSRIVSMLGITP